MPRQIPVEALVGHDAFILPEEVFLRHALTCAGGDHGRPIGDRTGFRTDFDLAHEMPHRAHRRFEPRVLEDLNAGMGFDPRDHGRQHRLNGLAEISALQLPGVSPQAVAFFYQDRRKVLVRQAERRLHARQSATDHQRLLGHID